MQNTLNSPVRAALENVRTQIQEASFPERQRIELLGSVDFFYKQLLCETDRRDPDHLLRERWRLFEERFFDSLPAEDIQKQLPSRESLRQFFLPLPMGARPADVPMGRDSLSERRAAFGIDGVFRRLMFGVRRDRTLSEDDRNLCLIGLRYLEVEAKRAVYDRDQRLLKLTWRKIHPLLKEIGLLRHVRGVNMQIKTELLTFLVGEGELSHENHE